VSTEPVEQFKARYESLAGQVHVVADVAEAVRVIATVFAEAKATRVALAELPEGLGRALEGHCADVQIEVLKPPFDRSTLPHAIDEAQVGVGGARFAIGDFGTLVEVATNDANRLVSALPRTHVGVVRAADILATHEEAAPLIRDIFEKHGTDCSVSFISGPSRTGDIEMKLTLGVHGPGVSHAVIIEGED